MTDSEPMASLREHVLELLRGAGAHAWFEDVVADWPEDLRGVKLSERLAARGKNEPVSTSDRACRVTARNLPTT